MDPLKIIKELSETHNYDTLVLKKFLEYLTEDGFNVGNFIQWVENELKRVDIVLKLENNNDKKNNN